LDVVKSLPVSYTVLLSAGITQISDKTLIAVLSIQF